MRFPCVSGFSSDSCSDSDFDPFFEGGWETSSRRVPVPESGHSCWTEGGSSVRLGEQALQNSVSTTVRRHSTRLRDLSLFTRWTDGLLLLSERCGPQRRGELTCPPSSSDVFGPHWATLPPTESRLHPVRHPERIRIRVHPSRTYASLVDG